jgi:hypothetical protein
MNSQLLDSIGLYVYVFGVGDPGTSSTGIPFTQGDTSGDYATQYSPGKLSALLDQDGICRPVWATRMMI